MESLSNQLSVDPSPSHRALPCQVGNIACKQIGSSDKLKLLVSEHLDENEERKFRTCMIILQGEILPQYCDDT